MEQLQKRRLYTLIILCSASLFFAIFQLLSYTFQQKQRLENARNKAKQETVRVTLELERKLGLGEAKVRSLAQKLTEGRLSDRQLLEELKSFLNQNPNILNMGVAYQPFAHGNKQKLFGRSYEKINGKLQELVLENRYNYTLPEYIWYANALSQGAHWGEPYISKNTEFRDSPVVGFYAPFYQSQTEKAEPRGVVYAEYSLNTVKETMQSLTLGKTGYGFIVSETGILVYHPNQEYVQSRTNIFQLTYQQTDKTLRDLVTKSLQGEPVEADLKDEVTGENSWLFLRQIQRNGWAVGIVFIKDEVLPNNLATRRKQIGLSLAFLLFLLLFSALVFRVDKGKLQNFWAVSITGSILFAIEIGFIWNLALLSGTYIGDRNLLLSQTGVNQLLAPQIDLSEELNQKPPLFVPTGVYIQSLDIVSAKGVFITGYIWQKYDHRLHEKLSRGFILPDAQEDSDYEVREEYRHKEGNVETIGWYFAYTFRQEFDFNNYPFDYKYITIKIWHQDFFNPDLERPVLLVPDFQSYQVINPKTNPGVNENIVLGSWYLNDSFFEYRFTQYNTNFGIGKGTFVNQYPELSFNMVLQRDFTGPFITKLGPLLVVVSLLFAMLVIVDSDKSMEVLGACSGFVFIVILDQIATREQIITKGIIYMEYFYFVIYIFIFLVAFNAILLLARPNFPLIKYQNNAISKLLYWPSILQLLLIITIIVFC